VIKVAFIGAGSVVFSKNLTGDILSYPEFRGATFSYMDIDSERLEVGAALCKKVAKALGANPKIEATKDRREAVKGADFVINMVQIGGFDSTLVDFEIPRKYGLNFTIADTTGPGGLFRALRTFPMLSGLARDMDELCPKAILLNYSNPMSMNMQTITRTSNIRTVGLCHSVQGTFNQLMGYIGEDPDKIAFICAGINHMAFYLKMEKNGVDLYPRLFAAMEDQKTYNSNRVRFELMKRLGYFVTESSEHNAEYCPFFIPHGADSVARLDVPIDEYLRRCDGVVEEFERLKIFTKSDKPIEVHRSHEYGSLIIHSVATGTPRVIYGNMPNHGAIANLPPTAIAEAPTLVDRNGLQFTTVGELPPQLVGYMQPHVTQHELFIRAAIEGRRDHVYQAAMFDPLTAATLPLDKIVEMCDELIAAHGNSLPKLDSKKTLVPTSGKPFGAVDPRTLRASWDAAQKKQYEHAIADWHVLGPIKHENARAGLEVSSPFEDEFLRCGDGAVDLKASCKAGGSTLKWTAAKADRRGFVDLGLAVGAVEFANAYAYTEIESIHARETVLSIGSDDGVQVWLNGKMVHKHETGRPFVPGSDKVPVHLKAGINRLVLKIDNYVGGWGFGVMVPPANF
jgi:alpha-galactosidase